MLGEETRLLYVAMTRARDLLILTGSTSRRRFDKYWKSTARSDVNLLSSAKCYADWLGCWFAATGASDEATDGENDSCRWKLYPDPLWAAEAAEAPPQSAGASSPLTGDEAAFEKLLHRLAWQYPFVPATTQAAKSSVTRLRRQAADLDENDAQLLFQPPFERNRMDFRARAAGPDSAAELGRLHHTFLQMVSLERTGSTADLELEVQRMVAQKTFKAEEAKQLNLQAVAGFWSSNLGAEIRSHSKYVLRELPFTARFSPAEITALTGSGSDAGIAEDFVIVQGVADLVVCLPQELWIIDFKTDRMNLESLAEKASLYAPPLKLYARALSGIYRRPVARLVLYFLDSRQQVAVPADWTMPPIAQMHQ